MPQYPFKCEDGCVDPETKEPIYFEVEQKMSDAHEANCPVCDKPAKRILGVGGISFKGSGFHVNDYPRR